MIFFLTLSIFVASLPLSKLTILPRQLEAVPHSCTGNSIPCGPGTTCCPPGSFCNTRRGIPACEKYGDAVISAFTGSPCTDPYLRDCSKVGIIGYCCPIGTVCFNNGENKIVTCIDAYGTTAVAYPSATLGVVPSASPVSPDNSEIVYSPPSAWTSSTNGPSCSSSSSLRVSSTVNSSISFNYTGTVTSPQGGMFSVFVDGFNTTGVIDTFSDDSVRLPLCYPLEFPPFITPPPDLFLRDNHTITLIHTGPSRHAPKGTTSSSVQFDSFAIPKFKQSSASSVRDGSGLVFLNLAILVIMVPVVSSI